MTCVHSFCSATALPSLSFCIADFKLLFILSVLVLVMSIILYMQLCERKMEVKTMSSLFLLTLARLTSEIPFSNI